VTSTFDNQESRMADERAPALLELEINICK
jgi:hypothetical protein